MISSGLAVAALRSLQPLLRSERATVQSRKRRGPAWPSSSGPRCRRSESVRNGVTLPRLITPLSEVCVTLEGIHYVWGRRVLRCRYPRSFGSRVGRDDWGSSEVVRPRSFGSGQGSVPVGSPSLGLPSLGHVIVHRSWLITVPVPCEGAVRRPCA